VNLLEIEFLGTRGNIEASALGHSKHSGILVDQKILFDLGEKEFLDRKPQYIFITHLHPDHAFFMAQEIGDLGIPIFAPEKSARLPQLQIISQTVRAASHRVTPIPTVHSQKVKSRAYLVEDGSHRLLYTGDLISVDEEYRGLIDDLDLVVADGSFMKRSGLIRKDKVTGNPYGHNGIPDLVDSFRDFTDWIVFTHFGSWFYRNIENSEKEIEALGDGVKVQAAFDGLVLVI
jgi:ribonuclease BN (tRNA processing enzyme)